MVKRVFSMPLRGLQGFMNSVFKLAQLPLLYPHYSYINKRAKTAMFRVKKLLGGTLSLRNYNAQVGETYAMIKALNKLTVLGMPKTIVIA